MIDEMAADPRDAQKLQNGFFWLVLAAGVTAFVLAIGLFVFAANVDVREAWHGWYLLAFFTVSAGLGLTIGYHRFSLALLMVVLLALILGISFMKFEWRRHLQSIAQNPTMITVLGDYIRVMPNWELQFLPFSHAPKWIKFDEECYRPALSQGSFPESCKTKDGIQAAYNINVLQEINSRYSLMKTTARQVNAGQLISRDAYIACLSAGSCAPIPLLPANINGGDILDTDATAKDIRVAFWSLVDKQNMTVDLCSYIALCKAMTATGAITRTDFPSAN